MTTNNTANQINILINQVNPDRSSAWGVSQAHIALGDCNITYAVKMCLVDKNKQAFGIVCSDGELLGFFRVNLRPQVDTAVWFPNKEANGFAGLYTRKGWKNWQRYSVLDANDALNVSLMEVVDRYVSRFAAKSQILDAPVPTWGASELKLLGMNTEQVKEALKFIETEKPNELKELFCVKGFGPKAQKKALDAVAALEKEYGRECLSAMKQVSLA